MGLPPEFSWLEVRSHSHVPDGSYACDTFDQHRVGWCGCCYIVAVVQAIEDRGHVVRPRSARHRVDMQTVVDHFNASTANGSTWNACHGGHPEHVVECLASGACPLLTSRCRRWLGRPARTSNTPLSTAPFRVTGARRAKTSDIAREVHLRGPVVLEISAQTLKSVDAEGVVTDMTLRECNHAVAVVGWRRTKRFGPCWIVRNSWGTHRVPKSIPDDVHCVDLDGNRCEVEWEYWSGDPVLAGFCYVPAAHPMFHAPYAPWIVPSIVPL